jgi:hypothetical protein
VNITPALVSSTNLQLQNLINSMSSITAANGGPFSWVIWRTRSRVPASTPGGPPGALIAPFPQAVISAGLSGILATQRRRLRKAAHH